MLRVQLLTVSVNESKLLVESAKVTSANKMKGEVEVSVNQ